MDVVNINEEIQKQFVASGFFNKYHESILSLLNEGQKKENQPKIQRESSQK